MSILILNRELILNNPKPKFELQPIPSPDPNVKYEFIVCVDKNGPRSIGNVLQFVKNNSANAAQKSEDTAKNGINNAKVLADTDKKRIASNSKCTQRRKAFA